MVKILVEGRSNVRLKVRPKRLRLSNGLQLITSEVRQVVRMGKKMREAKVSRWIINSKI